MKSLAVLSLAALALSVPAFSQKKEDIQVIQRDIAILQDQMRGLDQRLTSIQSLIGQTADSVNKTNTSVATLESALRDRFQQQEKSVGGTVSNVGIKVDQMSEEFRGVRESIADLNSRMQKLQAQVTDVKNAITTMQSPPPPPAGGGAGSSSSGPPAGMSADSLYGDALRDYTAGKYDIAQGEFTDYLRYFGSTDYAPNAQFYLGMVDYNQQRYDSAFKNFDMVLEKFPDNNKTPDAMYMKGLSLLKQKQPTAASQEFRSLIAKYPSSDLSKKAKAELDKLGLPYRTPAATRRKK
jgi:tol-pal system protein YbgF